MTVLAKRVTAILNALNPTADPTNGVGSTRTCDDGTEDEAAGDILPLQNVLAPPLRTQILNHLMIATIWPIITN